jgi:hypothetical protein
MHRRLMSSNDLGLPSPNLSNFFLLRFETHNLTVLYFTLYFLTT